MPIHNVILKILFVCFLMSVVSEVNAYQANTDKAIITVTLENSLKIESLDDKNPDLILGNLLALEADRGNNIYVLDYKERAVLKFNEYGKFIQKIGRMGKGPGEFVNPLSMTAFQDSLLAVLDVDLLRISILNSDVNDSKRAQTYNLDLKSAFKGLSSRPRTIYYSHASDQLLIGYSIPFSPGTSKDKRERSIYLFDGKKTSQNPVLTVREHEMMVEDFGGMLTVGPLPFGGKSKIMVHDNKIYHGWTNTPTISISNTEGRLLKEIVFDSPEVNITKKDIEKIYFTDFQKKNINQLPKIWPAFDWFVADESDRVWVATNTENRDNYEILIFDKSGTLIGKSQAAKSVELFVIKKGYAYGFETDTYGEKSVVRLKISGI